MEYIFYSIRSLFCCALIVEFIGTGLVIWGIRHEEKLICIEDFIIEAIVRFLKTLTGKLKVFVIFLIRKTFIFFYRPYRRFKRRILNRLLRQFGLCAVKAEKESSYEVLSGR